MKKYISNSAQETKKIAQDFAAKFLEVHNKINVIALSGDLGSGKTTFVQGFAEGLGIQDKIISPTFVLIRHHPIPNSTHTLYHIDLYRLENVNDLKSIGLDDLIKNPQDFILIEWAEKAEELLPKNTTWIYFKPLTENKRELTFK